MAKLVRNFGQTPEYWENTCTLPDWLNIWQRELIAVPPVDALVAGYLGYEPPTAGETTEEFSHGLPEYEE